MKIYLAGAEPKENDMILTKCKQKNRLLSYYSIRYKAYLRRSAAAQFKRYILKKNYARN